MVQKEAEATEEAGTAEERVAVEKVVEEKAVERVAPTVEGEGCEAQRAGRTRSLHRWAHT